MDRLIELGTARQGGGIVPGMTRLAGVDIGGTKCTVSIGEETASGIEIIDRDAFPTPATPAAALDLIVAGLERLWTSRRVATLQPKPAAIGVSCGGPLDSRAGLVLSPPNLPGWDRIDVVTPLRDRFDVPVALQNDANAGALAEWMWGAGRGCASMIFLTFGTGMGAGLILDGRLYEGATGLAGEVGHIRLEPDGPIGYGKAGSFEGFCSGGGIAQLARSMAESWLRAGRAPLFCPTRADLPAVTARTVGEAAGSGDPLAQEVFAVVGRSLGRGLATLVDILNPERIIIGSIYGRQQALLEPVALRELRREGLQQAVEGCQVVPAGLGERVGEVASLSIARHALELIAR